MRRLPAFPGKTRWISALMSMVVVNVFASAAHSQQAPTSPPGADYPASAAQASALTGASASEYIPPAASAPVPSRAEVVDGRQMPPPMPQPGVGEAMRRNGGSLLRATLETPADPRQAGLKDTSFFYVPKPEPRSIKKHDLVTIVIREESKSSSTGQTDTKKSTSFDAAVEEWISLNLANLSVQGGGIGGTAPSVKLNANREFKGDGSVDRSDSVTLRVQAEVLDVKPNDTLVVQARKRIKNDDEELTVILTGICRAEDITLDNTVLSTQLADLNLEKMSKGQVRNAGQRGWLTKLLDVVDPF